MPIPRSALPISLTAARSALAEATDLPTVASLIDRLEVIRVAARKARQSLDAQNDWAVVKLEAERRAGRMLAELRQRGDLRAGRPNADGVSALAELGIGQQQSSRWQRLAAVPEDRFTRWIDDTRAFGAEVTEAGLFAVAARIGPSHSFGSFGPLNVTPAPPPAGVVPRNVLLEGDCLPILRTLPDACVDALVTDPPAAIGFMGAAWDTDRGGRDAWVAWMTAVMRECARVLKPGAHGLVWALPRTSHWTAWALEDAGFEIRDQVLHVFAQGMPKSLDVSKELDRRAGVRREIIGRAPWSQPPKSGHHAGMTGAHVVCADGRFTPDVTAPATDAAKEWAGHGSALKPAHEVWWLVRKPLSGPIAENVLRYGTGTLRIDDCRIHGPAGDGVWGSSNASCVPAFNGSPEQHEYRTEAVRDEDGRVGRYPSNVILTDAVFDGDYPDEVVGGGTSSGGAFPTQRGPGVVTAFGAGRPAPGGARQMGDAGGKSRFFLLPKASRRDRDSDVNGEPIGLPEEPFIQYQMGHGSSGRPSSLSDGRDTHYRNTHTTTKSRALMRWLVRLIAPKGALVLDPFAGSGTTGLAAHDEGCDYLLIEQDPDYVDIARARLGDSLDDRHDALQGAGPQLPA